MRGVLHALGDLGLVPVVKIEREEDAVDLASALSAGGLPCAEITFRTEAAEEAIRRISSSLRDVLVGAGTVLSVDQAERAVSAGAQFIVSPGFNQKVVDWCLENAIAVTPGVLTPTEIEMARDRGLDILKFFPAEAMGGIATLRAIGAPYGDVKFVPTGGINRDNLADYLALPNVHCCGGSWLVKANLISAGKFDEITQLTQDAMSVVRQVRG
ncbi:MAG: bifunctional 4-hydroxy-2-oxoglutarate aldolase/2-dehydro-3-deoxy-phosphogluconate aldolase [Anaerolineae bacterium]|nr:bifunctional 4-hydroxy-2-oxoglutarate aldolase/2-dehydro-3-deoxy-phosphogluconate aldolase [Anaerolineae bacterium]NIN93853.1 bifunctional 4-hydroxy-2-oxoglutarate aldolase/2-dehydro-3-deoxy-phosphogluconate aldolase [Anaerolineae bacterium]NIQ76888.1 bifunctional 4-hydroxy-2-oxoglutarate aldolase/2-dehydro-3-deoxy-phosphogluconate aldolase [Anaerolineae bacterium]